jgi:shikimate 5-dehydrogenase
MQDRRGGGKSFMGYPIEMIGKDTTLYAYIGTNAIEQEHAEIFNNYLKAADYNAKVMPLNIREDDIGFFIHGFKDSKIKAGYFSKEYWQTLFTLLENVNEEVKICGICDYISVKDKQNKGELLYGKAASSLVGENLTVAIYGNTPTAKSFLYNVANRSTNLIILADMIVENTLDMQKFIPDDIKSDIQRIEAKDIKADVIYDSTNERLIVGNNVYTYNDILEKIAEIKTKEWIKNG